MSIIVECIFGLGNRFRALASAYSIAKASKKNLSVIWKLDDHCECRLDEIIVNIDDLVKKVHYAEEDTIKSDHKYFNYYEVEQDGKKNQFVDVDKFENIYVKTNCVINSRYSYKYFREFFERITFHINILNIIEAYNVENCIGMHIRMEGGQNYQTQKADKEALWTEEERKMMFKWRECSHIDNFINQINHILHENPDQKFFIATDLESNYEKLLRLYGESRIKYLKRSVFDRSKLQQCYALADILLLSRCKMFYGSYWSSFSELVTYFQTDVIRKDNVFSNKFYLS